MADGVILDSVTTAAELRTTLAEVDTGRASAARTDPYLVVVYVEPPAHLTGDELTDHVRSSVTDLAGAGATSIVFVASPDHPDPGPLLQALSALSQTA